MHIASGAEPRLSESEKPTGSWDWNTGLATNEIESVDVYGEGADSGAEEGDFDEDLDNEI